MQCQFQLTGKRLFKQLTWLWLESLTLKTELTEWRVACSVVISSFTFLIKNEEIVRTVIRSPQPHKSRFPNSYLKCMCLMHPTLIVQRQFTEFGEISAFLKLLYWFWFLLSGLMHALYQLKIFSSHCELSEIEIVFYEGIFKFGLTSIIEIHILYYLYIESVSVGVDFSRWLSTLYSVLKCVRLNSLRNGMKVNDQLRS